LLCAHRTRLSEFSVSGNEGLCGPSKSLLNERAGRHSLEGTMLENPCPDTAFELDEYAEYFQNDEL
jgi:hypothetical protein